MRTVFDLYGRLIINHPRKVLWALTCVTLFMGFLAFRLPTNNAIETWLLDGDPKRVSYQKFVETFGTEEFVLLVYSEPEMFSKEAFRLNHALTEKLETIEGIDHVWSLSEIYHDLVSRLPAGASLSLERFKTRVVGHPLFTGNLISDDGVTTAVVAVLTPEGVKDRRKIVREIREAATEVCPNKTMRFAGPPVMSAELDRIAGRDPRVFTPLVVVLASGILFILFRRLTGIRIPMAVAGMSIVWSLGAFSLMGGTMNLVLAIMPPLILMTSIGDTIHLLCRYQFRIQGSPPEKAVLEAVKDVWKPCLMTSLTTAVGFGSLAVSGFSPVRSFGMLSALGIGFAYVITMLLAPASLVYKHGAGLSTVLESSGRTGKILSSIKTIHAERPGWILSAFAAVTIVGLLGMSRLNVEANTLKFFPADGEIRRTYEFVEEHLTGLSPFEILLQGEGLASPAVLAAIDRIEDYLSSQPYVTHSFSIRSLQAGFSGRNEPTPASQGLRIPALFKGQERSFLSRDGNMTHISGRGLTMNSILYTRAMDEIESFAKAALPKGISAELTGVVPMITSMDRYLLVTFIKSFAMALVVIAVLMSLNFRSLRLGLLSMIPNLIPILAVLGIMGFFKIDLNPATVTIAAISLGVSVDDTIHYMHHYLRLRKGGEKPQDAAAFATTTVGRAMIYTTWTLVAGFIVMVSSDFGPTRLFGLLSGFCMILALLCDLFLLPVLLKKYEPAIRPKFSSASGECAHVLEEYQDAL